MNCENFSANGMGYLEELRAASPPDWALEEAEYFIDQNPHRVVLDAPAGKKKYYVVYSLRKENAVYKQYGIFTVWSEVQTQIKGCTNRRMRTT